jgi:chromosome segregation ATPase
MAWFKRDLLQSVEQTVQDIDTDMDELQKARAELLADAERLRAEIEAEEEKARQGNGTSH